mgnify:CR=1 FL=1
MLTILNISSNSFCYLTLTCPSTTPYKKKSYLGTYQIIVNRAWRDVCPKFQLKIGENKLTIQSITLNNHPIDTKGEIKIYEIQKKSYLTNRLFWFPDIQTLDRSLFEQLFPNEPFEQSDNETKEVLVKTLSFDTKKNKDISLDFLNSFKNGVLRVIL